MSTLTQKLKCWMNGHQGPFEAGSVFGDEIQTVVCGNCEAEIPRVEVAPRE